MFAQSLCNRSAAHTQECLLSADVTHGFFFFFFTYVQRMDWSSRSVGRKKKGGLMISDGFHGISSQTYGAKATHTLCPGENE